jgi:hypothetical protein
VKFTPPGPRLLGAQAGIALLGAVAVAVAVATASPASHPRAATLDVLSHARPTAAPVPVPVPASARPAPVPWPTSAKHPRVGAVASAPVPASPPREGRVIGSGVRAGRGELVFYGVRIHTRQLPGITFGIMAGLRSASGGLIPEVETNEITGAGTSPGFHAIEAPTTVGSPEVVIPEFGYYAGPAATITAERSGQLVHASLARWSVDPSIVVFWFPGTTPASTPLTGLAAYTNSGHLLPAGSTTTGHG